MVAHRLAQELAQATEQNLESIDTFIQRLDKAFPLDHDDDEVVRRLDASFALAKRTQAIEARALTSLENM